MTVYKRGAKEVVRRLRTREHHCNAVIRIVLYTSAQKREASSVTRDILYAMLLASHYGRPARESSARAWVSR